MEKCTKDKTVVQATYTAYTNNNFQEVFKNYHYISEEYPLSPLLPKFTFLNAEHRKTEPARHIFNALPNWLKFLTAARNSYVERYFGTVTQGEEAQQGGTGSLMEPTKKILQQSRRNRKNTELTRKNTPFTLILVPKHSDNN